MTSLLPCAHCGEGAIIVPLQEMGQVLYFARVRRFSKCRFYKANQVGLKCKTDLEITPEIAARAWNKKQTPKL